MEHLRKVLLMASVATILPAQVLSQSSLSYEKTLSVAIHFYNQVHGIENVFKVLEVHPPPSNQKPQDQRLKLLSFAMKEMVCPRTGELPLDQCDFKRDGLVKKCQGSISNEQDIPSIILTCDPVAPVTPAVSSLFFPLSLPHSHILSFLSLSFRGGEKKWYRETPSCPLLPWSITPMQKIIEIAP
uniref:Uncharacterized protein n=1 Tax=Monodelphis domestica TaxID=13616 RepID=A0A5F8G7A6_MONDO